MVQHDLSQRFSALRDGFCAASDCWPNLESILITWPEDKPQPQDADIAAKLAAQYYVPVPAPEGEVHFVATLIGGASMDTPAYRYRAGLAGMLILRRSFGRFGGDPRRIEDPVEQTACGDRLRALSEAGARELEEVGKALGLSANTLGWKGLTKWRLAVHETVKPKQVGSTGCRSCEVLQDFFLASAQAIDKWIQEPGTPTPPTAATRRKTRSTVKGEARAKIIAALSLHHKYQDGSCPNLEPIGVNELARKAKVSKSTASAFLKNQFGGHAKYRKACRDVHTLSAVLRLPNDEFAPKHLLGGTPPEGNRSDRRRRGKALGESGDDDE